MDERLSNSELEEKLKEHSEQLLLFRLEPRYWMARAIVALEVLILIVVVSLFEPASLTAKAIAKTGDFGWVLVFGLAACCLVALADVLINDLMPGNWRLPFAFQWRHMAFMLIAMQLAVIGFMVVFSLGFTILLFAYWLNASLACLLAFLDAFARFPRLQK